MPISGGRRASTRHPVLSDMLDDRPNQQLIEEFDDQMIARARNALRVNPFWMDVFPKIQAGRRCSCFGIADNPDGFCVSCFGSGVVGGYDKYLCATEMLEVTRPDIALVNVLPDFKSMRAPVPLSLIKTAVQGYAEFVVKLDPNIGVLDLFKVYSFSPPSTSVTVLFAPGGGSWQPATFDAVQAALGTGVLKFRVVLSRQNPQSPLPYLKGIRLRYQVREGSRLVRVNSPLPELSQQLQDMGIWETFQSLQFFLDDTLSIVRNDDLFRNARNGTIWKTIQVKDNAPSGRTTSWLLNTRRIQPGTDPQANFPFGELGPVSGTPQVRHVNSKTPSVGPPGDNSTSRPGVMGPIEREN